MRRYAWDLLLWLSVFSSSWSWWPCWASSAGAVTGDLAHARRCRVVGQCWPPRARWHSVVSSLVLHLACRALNRRTAATGTPVLVWRYCSLVVVALALRVHEYRRSTWTAYRCGARARPSSTMRTCTTVHAVKERLKQLSS